MFTAIIILKYKNAPSLSEAFPISLKTIFKPNNTFWGVKRNYPQGLKVWPEILPSKLLEKDFETWLFFVTNGSPAPPPHLWHLSQKGFLGIPLFGHY